MNCKTLATLWRDRWTSTLVPLSLTDTGLLNSVFLIACRHLSKRVQHGEQQELSFTELSMQYKLDCLKSLRKEISSKSLFDDATIAKTVMLVCKRESEEEKKKERERERTAPEEGL